MRRRSKIAPRSPVAIETVPIALRVFTVTFLMREPCPALRCFRAAGEFCCRSAHSGLNAASFRHSEQRRTNSIVPAAENESIKRRTAAVERVISNAVQRLERKIEKFNLAICDEAELEKLRHFGELLTANLHALPPRAENAKGA